MLEGSIIVGDELVWEPRDPRAYERITVVAVVRGQIQTIGRRGTFWNDEDRVREACIRAAKPDRGSVGQQNRTQAEF